MAGGRRGARRADYGREDAEAWLVPYAAREALDGDGRFDVLDPPLVLVRKADGVAERPTLLAVLDRVDAMQPVGALPPADVGGQP